ncbi:DivIVA domain-containing protein [Deinococcus taeanensis]|uniref:DivIVA domain-containing protein n=1 Tax=Deinococcus taeanensis TaxID=2737050 RepID=UPI001CDCCADA|nr:DivIVA domain-containing protein [Deinococcus taeanensis]UBV43434.1 DivIVA domain-containing protein [Deinococcus taeanensis]
MKFTPLDVRHQEFPSRMGGYDRSSVRAFLNDLADDLELQLQQHHSALERTRDLERDLEAQRQNEDEIRRAVVAAERISHELRENAAREAELMVAQATTERDGLLRETEARRTELEAGHQARQSALEAAFRGRFADLERDHHNLILERERAQAERLAALERTFSDRHADLTARLTAARQEYAQFLSGYRALLGSFTELAARHVPPEEPALPVPRLPHAAPTATDEALPVLPPTAAAQATDPASPPDLNAAPLAGHALITPGPAQVDADDRPLRIEAQQFL